MASIIERFGTSLQSKPQDTFLPPVGKQILYMLRKIGNNEVPNDDMERRLVAELETRPRVGL